MILSIDCLFYYVDKSYVKRLEQNGSVDIWFIVGNNYVAYPGRYPYIQQSGYYQIYNQDGITMVRNRPRGSQQGYEHPVTHYLRATMDLKLATNNIIYDCSFKPSQKFHTPITAIKVQPDVVSLRGELPETLGKGCQPLTSQLHDSYLHNLKWTMCNKNYRQYPPDKVYGHLQEIQVDPSLVSVTATPWCCAVICCVCSTLSCNSTSLCCQASTCCCCWTTNYTTKQRTCC